MKKYSTYLFDFDGTLVDSYDSLVKIFEGAYNSVGVSVPDGYVLRLMRIPLRQGYEELHGPSDEDSINLFASQITALLEDEPILRLTKQYGEVLDTLYRLKNEGATLGIVTSNDVEHVKKVLEFLNIPEDLFSVIVGSYDTKKHKPHPDPILKALERLNISKSGVCYVGDALADKLAAINAGVDDILLDRYHEYESEGGVKIKLLSEL